MASAVMPGPEHAMPADFSKSGLDSLQRQAFGYFLNETNPANGLVADKSQAGAPASIAAVGFALAAYPVGVTRGWMTRGDAIARTLAILRFFWSSAQGPAPDATGHKGFYYHFLDMITGRRAGFCELSTVDTSFLLAGMLATASYFDHESKDEQEIYGYEFIYGGPLFIHQYSHVWLDLRGIQDAFAREKGIDYCENSRRATYVQREYAIRNPLGFAGYGEHFWGLTASDGPGWTTRRINGIERPFFDYVARGAPYGPDDGTIAAWAVVASLPFAPEIVLPAIHHLQDVYPQITGEYCFRCSFNLSFPSEDGAETGWTSPSHFGINLGPVVLMCENYRSGLLWRLLRECPGIVTGLRRAGFTHGWL